MEVASYKTEGNVLHRTRSMCQVGLMNGSLHRNKFLNFHVSFIKALVILLCREPKDFFRSVENGSFSWSHGVSLPGRELGSTNLHCRPAWKSAFTSADLKLPTLSFFLRTSHSLGLGLRWSFNAANKGDGRGDIQYWASPADVQDISQIQLSNSSFTIFQPSGEVY